MTRPCLVTLADSNAPLDWGLDVGRIGVPTVLFCSPEGAAAFRERAASPDVLVVPTRLPRQISLHDRLARLYDACTAAYHQADQYYWVDIELLYQHLSFEYLYSDVLVSALRRRADAPAYFSMPGYAPSSFFGGPKLVLEAAFQRLEADAQALFGIARDPSPAVAFHPAFGAMPPRDLNLELADEIAEPLLHVIGDSHVYNCFTLNAAIGCRSNVLVRTPDVSAIAVPYPYQFTHHLGSRTMHHAARPGALVAIAEQCGVKNGDAVVWVFGEIDVRCHLVKLHHEEKRPLDELVDRLARDYVRGILDVAQRYERLRQVVFAPIPPLDNPDYASADLPVHGSIEERVAARRLLRAALAARCGRHAIQLLEAPESFETARGDLPWELSDHFCHIASSRQGPIVERLYALLAG